MSAARSPTCTVPSGGGRQADLLDHLHPHIPFSVCSVATLIALLVGRCRDTEKGMLRQAAQYGLRLWDDGQNRLQQETTPSSITDWPQAGHRGMCGQIDLRRILHEQDDGLLGQPRTGLALMRLHQCLKGDLWFVKQPVHRFQGFPGALLFGQGGGRIADQPTGGDDRPPGAPPISRLRLPKGLFRPLVVMQQVCCVHQPPRFPPILAKMWVKDRLSSQG